jgi:hypothetical protein
MLKAGQQMTSFLRAARLMLVGALIGACGGSGNGADPTAFYSTGDDLVAALGWDCTDWDGLEVPPPDEQNLYCSVDGRPVAGGVLYPDDYYRSSPDDLIDDFNRVVEEMPEEACEHFGGGPMLVGANWWVIAQDSEWLEAAQKNAGGRFSGSVECQRPYWSGER